LDINLNFKNNKKIEKNKEKRQLKTKNKIPASRESKAGIFYAHPTAYAIASLRHSRMFLSGIRF
jgi:hypothetical protein